MGAFRAFRQLSARESYLNGPKCNIGAVRVSAPSPSTPRPSRSWTAEELAATARDINRETLTAITRAQTALDANAEFLADASVTTAEAVTQLRRLTRQVSALIRLGRDELLDTIDGT